MTLAFRDLLSEQERGEEMVSWGGEGRLWGGGREGGRMGRSLNWLPPPSVENFEWRSGGNPASPQRWPGHVHPLTC